MHTCICLYREVCFSSRGFLSRGVLSGFFVCPPSVRIKFKSVTSHALGPPLPVTNCHTFLDPLERDVLYGRPPTSNIDYRIGLLCDQFMKSIFILLDTAERANVFLHDSRNYFLFKPVLALNFNNGVTDSSIHFLI